MRMAIDESSPIGVFDSGVGGLTVVKSLYEQLPHEQILYFGDTAYVPYGGRQPKELIGFALSIADYLIQSGCKLIIIACNTSTALAYNLIRETSPIPVIGMIEPGVRSALEASGKGTIGIIATQVTVQSNAYQRLLAQQAPERDVFALACPDLVPLVESGITKDAAAKAKVQKCLQPIKERDIESLILGCTHYPYLLPELTKYAPADLFIDPSAYFAQFIKNDISPASGTGSERFYVSASPENFIKAAKMFFISIPDKIELQ